jgi:hypothetical protein
MYAGTNMLLTNKVLEPITFVLAYPIVLPRYTALPFHMTEAKRKLGVTGWRGKYFKFYAETV